MKKLLLILVLTIFCLTGYSYSATIDEQIKNEEIATYWDMKPNLKGCYLRSLEEPKNVKGIMFYQKIRPTLLQIEKAISGEDKTDVIEKKLYTPEEIDTLIKNKVTELVKQESLKEAQVIK